MRRIIDPYEIVYFINKLIINQQNINRQYEPSLESEIMYSHLNKR